MKKIIFLTVITLLTLPFSCREKDSGKAAGLDSRLKGDVQGKSKNGIYWAFGLL